MFLEALLLHHLDNLDSKMETMRAAADRDRLSDGEFTGWVSSLERVVLKKDKFLGAEESASPEVSSVANGQQRAAASRANPIKDVARADVAKDDDWAGPNGAGPATRPAPQTPGGLQNSQAPGGSAGPPMPGTPVSPPPGAAAAGRTVSALLRAPQKGTARSISDFASKLQAVLDIAASDVKPAGDGKTPDGKTAVDSKPLDLKEPG
jgi:hypothetical protein